MDTSSASAAATGRPETSLMQRMGAAIGEAGGFLPFDRFMGMALYDPHDGYYMRSARVLGHMPESGSDFVTGPELSPSFGRALAVAVDDAFEQTSTRAIWEFGAGSGALARQLLDALGERCTAYHIVEVSGALRAAQEQALHEHLRQRPGLVQWHEHLPVAIEGVVVGNEVLDAMPVKLLARVRGVWHEVGVALDAAGALHRALQPTDLRPPQEPAGDHDFETEIHPQAQAFIRTLGRHLQRGAAFFIDYGFPQSEYYHPQRHMGTLMAHRAHRAGGDWLQSPGLQDLTAHVDFTGVALTAQDAGFEVLGYTSQARFLMNCQLLSFIEQEDHVQRSLTVKLMLEHEMGELFKVLALSRGPWWSSVGFRLGDRTHTL